MTDLLSVRLQKAHDYLAAHKWTRGHYARNAEGTALAPSQVTDDCSVCAWGAYYVGNGISWYSGRVDQELAQAMTAACDGTPLHDFNDVVAHDKRDVLRKFRIAIRAAQKLGN